MSGGSTVRPTEDSCWLLLPYWFFIGSTIKVLQLKKKSEKGQLLSSLYRNRVVLCLWPHLFPHTPHQQFSEGSLCTCCGFCSKNKTIRSDYSPAKLWVWDGMNKRKNENRQWGCMLIFRILMAICTRQQVILGSHYWYIDPDHNSSRL